ncbi:hypothetical protein ACOMHN_019374 [Nucella lapillus]
MAERPTWHGLCVTEKVSASPLSLAGNTRVSSALLWAIPAWLCQAGGRGSVSGELCESEAEALRKEGLRWMKEGFESMKGGLNMTEEIVSATLQALPGPAFRQPPPSEEGRKPGPPEVTQRSDNRNPVSCLPEETHQRKEDSVSVKSLTEDLSRYGLTSDTLSCRDTSMPGPLQGVEEPQVAKDAILAEGQRPLESAKTPDMSLLASSHDPPQLEPVGVGEKEAGEQVWRAEDDHLQLPVLQREHGSRLETDNIEQFVPCATSMQSEDKRTNAVVTVRRNGAICPTKKALGAKDLLRKTPVVILERLSQDMVDSYKQSLQEPGNKCGDWGCRPLTVSKLLAERLSPLNEMLEESSVWSKCSPATTTSEEGLSVQLDENSNSDPGRQNHCVLSSVAVKPKPGAVSTVVQTVGSGGGKSAGVLKKRHAAEHAPSPLEAGSHAPNHRDTQTSTNSVGETCKPLSDCDSTDSCREPISYTAYCPGDLKMTFTSASKSLEKSGSPKEGSGLEIGSSKSSPKEPSVYEWEICPSVIFDCGSQGTPALLHTANGVSQIAELVERGKEKRDSANISLQNSFAELVLPSLVCDGNLLYIAESRPSQSGSDTDPDAVHRELSPGGGEGGGSVRVSQSEDTLVHTHAARGNTAESTASFVPSTSQNHPPRSTQQALISSKDNRQKHTDISAREPSDSEISDRLLDKPSLCLTLSHPESPKNGLNRSSPAQAARVKLVRNGLQTNFKGKRLKKLASPSKNTRTIPTSPKPQRVGQCSEPVDTPCDKSRGLDSNSRQRPQSGDGDRDVRKEARTNCGPHSPTPPLSVVTVRVAEDHATPGCRQDFCITCIEKTSPAFIIPHQEEKMVESDMIVMQNYYYSTLPSSSMAGSKAGVSGCCHKAAGGDGGAAAADSGSATVLHGQSSSRLTTSPSDTRLVPTHGESGQLTKVEECLSNQSHLENTGILMVSTTATKTLSEKVSTGRQRASFRSLSEDSDKNGNDAYKDVVVSSVVVDDKSFHTSLSALGLEHCTVSAVSEPEVHADVEEQRCKAQVIPAENPAQQGACVCKSSDGEEEPTAEVQPGDVTLSLQGGGPIVGEEILLALEEEEEGFLQSYEGEIMGQVQIREDNEDYNEVFDIVNERDVPIPHEAFLHSLSLLRNTGKATSACESARPERKTAVDSFCFGIVHDETYNKDKFEDDSDATLPYPRDEKRERSKPQSRPRKQKRSRKKKRKTTRTKRPAPSLAPIPQTSSETQPVSKKPRGRAPSQTKLIEFPMSVKGVGMVGERSPLCKKSTTRHPLFKQRHQSVSRRPKDKPKTVAASPLSPTKTPTTTAKTTSPSTPTKHSTPPSMSPSESPESDSGPLPRAGTMPKRSKSPNKPATTITAVSGTGPSAKANASRASGTRGTIAINSVPNRSPARSPGRAAGQISRRKKGEVGHSMRPCERKRKLDKDSAETDSRKEKSDSIFEGTRLTDESVWPCQDVLVQEETVV